MLDPAAQARLVWACLAIAIAARSVRFLLKFPLWEDECFLAANFIDRGFGDLLAPLNYHQVAPLLFLGIELTCVKLFGFAEWPLRLYPFLCSIGSLLLFRRLAGRLLEGLPLVLAVWPRWRLIKGRHRDGWIKACAVCGGCDERAGWLWR